MQRPLINGTGRIGKQQNWLVELEAIFGILRCNKVKDKWISILSCISDFFAEKFRSTRKLTKRTPNTCICLKFQYFDCLEFDTDTICCG